MIRGKARPPAALTATVVLGLVACSRSDATSSAASGADPARAVFLATPGSVPGVVREISAEFPHSPPAPTSTPLLVAAATTGFSASAFDRAFAAAPPLVTPPDEATRTALRKLEHAQGGVPAGAAAGSAEIQSGQAATIALMLPAIAAAREEGLALDRINLLVEATRDNPDVVRALAPSVSASDGADVMVYSRDNVLQEDGAWGGHQHARVAEAQTRQAAALRTLTRSDLVAISHWYAAPGGRAEVARAASALARAYDTAGAAMTKDYYRRLQSAQPSRTVTRP